MDKKIIEKRNKARIEAQPKLAVQLTDEISIWADERNYIIKDNEGKVLGYFNSLVPLIWKLFSMEVKLSLQQETDLKEVISKIDKAEKYIRSLAKKLEDLQQLG